MKLTFINKFSLALCVLGYAFLIYLFVDTFSTKTANGSYVITRTTGYPQKVEKISRTYKRIPFHDLKSTCQFVPIKAHIKLGLEYFCTVEMKDSSFLVYYTNNYVGNFHYEGLRFFVWNIIEFSTHNESIDYLIKEQDKNIVIKNSNKEFPDTILWKGLKIYDIEKYSFDKYIELDKANRIYVEPYYEMTE